MAHPKTIPFNRVRVMVMAEAGACLLLARRTLPEPRRTLEYAWRDPTVRKLASTRAVVRQDAAPGAGSAEPAEGAGPAAHDAAGATHTELLPLRDAEPDDGPCTEAVDEPVPEIGAESGAALPEEPLAAAPPPNPPLAPNRGETRVGAGSPLSAVARAVEEVEMVNALAAMLVDTCGDELTLATGPWDITLQLRAQGLGESRLDLHLTHELLSLRFYHLGPGVAQVLSRHRSTLLDLLQQQLPPWLAIEIEIAIVDA